MPLMIHDRALPATGRAFTRAIAVGSPPQAAADPALTMSSAAAHQGRGSAQLALADRILRQATVAREDVTPEMEPFSPSLTDEEPGEDFTDNEDVTDEMEPFDPSIESSLEAPERKVMVEGDEDEVTITAEPGEAIVAVTEEDSGDLEVWIEDEEDVLL